MKKVTKPISGGFWMFVLSILGLSIYALTIGFRVIFGKIEHCQQEVEKAMINDMILLNPVWIGFVSCFGLYCLVISIRHFVFMRRYRTLAEALEIAERTNILKGRLYRIAADMLTKQVDIEFYAPGGKIIKEFRGATDDVLYNWLLKGGGQESLTNIFQSNEFAEIEKIFKALSEQYGFAKSHGQILNVGKVIRRDEKSGKNKKIYTPDDVYKVNNTQEWNLNPDIES